MSLRLKSVTLSPSSISQPGTNNSIVSLWVFQVSDLSLVQVVRCLR